MCRRTSLFVDALNITISIDENLRRRFLSNLIELSQGMNNLRRCDSYDGAYRDYEYAYRLSFGLDRFGDEQFCLVQASPRRFRQNANFVRLDWNPQKAREVCPDAATQIFRLMADCLEDAYDPSIITGGRFTRIDLSFDVLRQHVDNLLVYGTPLRQYSTNYWNPRAEYLPNGRLNSMEIGKKGSDRRLMVYDKWLEEKNREIQANRRLAEPINRTRRNRTPKTRFELTLRSVGPLSRLGTMDNPFALYSVQNVINVQRIENAHISTWFIDSCQRRGMQAALSLIKNRRERERYANAFSDLSPPSWWNPEEIWGEYPRAIQRAFE